MGKVDERGELKKHVGTVEISNPLGLIQRKAFSILLQYAMFNVEKRDTDRTYRIPVGILCQLAGYDSNDFDHFDEQIGKLQRTAIKWAQNEEEFSRYTFFSYTGVKNGFFEYRFDPGLERALFRPEIYARINIHVLSLFQSKYAVALYENLARYRPNPSAGFAGDSPTWSLEEFRALMGVKGLSYYEDFKRFRSKIITPAIKEINANSDLIVSCETVKEGRRVVGVKFDIKDNPQRPLPLAIPATIEDQASDPRAVDMAETFGVPPHQCGTWLMEFGEERFEEVLAMAKRTAERGKLESPVGYIASAFDEGWKVGKSKSELAKERKEREKKKATGRAKKKAAKEAEEKREREEENRVYEEKSRELWKWADSLAEKERRALFERFFDEKVKGIEFMEKRLGRGDDPRKAEKKPGMVEASFMSWGWEVFEGNET